MTVQDVPYVTYSPEMSTDRDKVRFHLRDTVEESGPLPSGGNFRDIEITALITTEGSWRLAVAAGYEVLSAAWAGSADITLGPRRESLSQIADRYTALADEWRSKYGTTITRAGSRMVTRVDGYSDDIVSDEE